MPLKQFPLSSIGSPAVWRDQITVEQVNGVPFLMYAERPRQITEVLDLARRWGTRLYVVQGTREVSFSSLLTGVAEKAQELRALGLRTGDRVLILGWNSPDWMINFWACQQLGAVPALANAWWSEVEVREAVELLEPSLILADERGAGKVPPNSPPARWETVDRDANEGSVPVTPDREIDEGDPAVIIFTSGTAGRPKAVELSHRALLANLQMILHITHRLPDEVKDSSGEVTLHTGPLFHVGGPQMLLRSIAVGNTMVLPQGRFDPSEVLALIERYKVSRWAAVPTMVTRILDHPEVRTRDLTNLRALTTGGAPIHPELLERIHAELPAVKAGVPTGYGMTENCGQATAASARDTLKHPGSAGRPLPLAEISFAHQSGLPDPEILIRAPTQMTRYIGLDESPIDDEGWLHTGDLGHFDDDGRLWITGRAKDLIIRGGENIAPAAVERALQTVPGVIEAAVVGVPHPDLGEEVCAFVVVAEAGPTGHTLADELRGRVASFAVPSIWYVQLDPLPTNQTEKVDKRGLRDRAIADARKNDVDRRTAGPSADGNTALHKRVAVESASDTTANALAGITVLDLGQAFMGPYCGFLLQRLGAEVIKVEPLQGEPYRRPTARKGTEPMQYGLLNAGKRSLSIDLKNPEGRELFIKLAATADVVIQNYAPDTFERLIGVEAALSANPRLILASGTGYGSSGPYKDMRAMDLTIQAMSGVMATTGFQDGPPVRTGPSVVDFMGGAHLTAAVLGALVQRAVTGKGQHVEVALYDAILPSLASNIAGYIDTDGEIPERTGNHHGGLAVAPYNAYATADGWVALLCLHDRHWTALCEVMGKPELTEHPSFSSPGARVRALERVDDIVGAWAASLPTDQVCAALDDAGVPSAPVKSLKDVVTDPHVAARGIFEYHQGPERDWWTLASPLRLAASPGPAPNLVARLGEHTGLVLAERLGLSEEEIEALRTAGVIGLGSELTAQERATRKSLAFADTADV